MVAWPIADRPRIHPLIARTYLRCPCFCCDLNTRNIKCFDCRVFPCRSDSKSHAISNNLEISIRNPDIPILRCGTRDDMRYEKFSTRNRCSKTNGLQRCYLKTELADSGVIGIPDKPRIVRPKHFFLPFRSRYDALLLS